MHMNNEGKLERRCPVCGVPIKGRSNKIFCCKKCKNAYHNEQRSRQLCYRNKIITSLTLNYRILEKLLSKHIDSMALCDIEVSGFKPSMVTGYKIIGNQKKEFRCFDIKYCMSDSKVYKIVRIKKP